MYELTWWRDIYLVLEHVIFRNMFYSNEQHDAEIESARVLVEEDIKKNSDDIVQCFDG